MLVNIQGLYNKVLYKPVAPELAHSIILFVFSSFLELYDCMIIKSFIQKIILFKADSETKFKL